MKRFFLGQAANYSAREILSHTFTFGTPRDAKRLLTYLEKRYGTSGNHVALTKNGRSALAIALKFTLPKNSHVIINGFTCYAVVEAVKAAGMTPVFADIDKASLHFTHETLQKVISKKTKAIIVQNTLGNPVDMKSLEKFANDHDLKIIEDLAHSVGVNYPDGRETGTVGVATVLSFGKEKSIDTITGGAVILRDPCLPAIKAPKLAPKFADRFRARFYPLFGATYRALKPLKLEKIFMGTLLKLKLVERSADNRLDLSRRPSFTTAKLALEQLKSLKNVKKPLRRHFFVENREKVLEELRAHGFFFDGLWYEKPVSPARYYKQVNFPEESCPVAVEVAKQIVNLPAYYPEKSLKTAIKIIKEAK